MCFRILCETTWLDLCLLKLHTAAARQWVPGNRTPARCFSGFFTLFFKFFAIISEYVVVGILKYGQVTQLASLVLAKR